MWRTLGRGSCWIRCQSVSWLVVRFPGRLESTDSNKGSEDPTREASEGTRLEAICVTC